jgi:hypothetical protein
MQRRTLTALAFWIAAVASSTCYADRGSITIIPDVSIFEPSQKAIIAWNGKEEILILSTDMRASRRTKVVEIMPFPSQPEVTAADTAVFQKTQEYLLRVRNHQIAEANRGRSMKGGSSQGTNPDVRFLFQRQVGQHTVTALKISSTANLQSSVNRILRANNEDTVAMPKALKSVIGQYIADGYMYFALDAVTVDSALSSQKPVSYRFKASEVYYPLRISRTQAGPATIDIIVINMNCGLRPDPKRCIAGIRERLSITMRPDSVRALDVGMYALVSRAQAQCVLTCWSVQANSLDLDRDVILRGRPWYSASTVVHCADTTLCDTCPRHW